jgi:hypothetical protein
MRELRWSAAALAAGISTFRAYVLEENVPMRRLLEGLGATAEFDSPGLLCMDLSLRPGSMPDTPMARTVRAAATTVYPEATPSDA